MRNLKFAAVSIGIGLALAACGTVPTDGRPISEATTSSSAPSSSSSTPEAEQSPTYITPTKKDYVLTVKTLSKHCFGSAGCNIEFRLKVGYKGEGAVDPSKTYEISYKIKGAEDPFEGTITVTDGKYDTEESQMVSTSSSSIKLVPVITEVSEL